MRWIRKTKTKYIPKDMDRRVVTRFLFLPLTLGRYTRWLEFAKINQEYHGCWHDNTGGFHVGSCEWFHSSWAD